LPFWILSLLLGTGMYRTYTCRPSSRLHVVVEVAGPDCAAAQELNNNDMSTALQTNVADMGMESLRAEV
jgi:hypothetical protein